jgi:dUTPase
MPEYTLHLQLDESAADLAYYRRPPAPSNENAGYDLVANESWSAATTGAPAHLLDLGVKAMMTRNDTGEAVHYWLLPRSSIFKTGHMMANSVGVIDKSYRGTLKAPVVKTVLDGTGFTRDQRYFQIVAPDMGTIVAVRVQHDALPTTVRGAGGFGSTG